MKDTKVNEWIEKGTVATILLLACYFLLFPNNSLIFLFDASAEVLSEWYPRFNVGIRFALLSFIPTLFALWVASRTASFEMFYSYRILAGLLALVAAGTTSYFLSCIVMMYGISISMFIYYSRHVFTSIIESLNKEEQLIWVRLFLMLAIAMAVLMRLYLVFQSDNAAHPDASCRLLISHLTFNFYLPDQNWLYILNPNPDWPPLHFYLNSVLLSLGLETTGIRLFHALIGVWSAAILYRIAREISCIEVALVVALGYLLYPASVIMSTQVVTEPLFLFTTIQSFRALQVFYGKRKSRNLARLIIWLFLGTMLRYEGWLLPGSFIILYLAYFRPISVKDLFKLCIPFIGPFFISTILILQGFHGLRGILYSDFQVAYCFDHAGRTLKVFVDGYKEGWIPFSILGLITATYVFRRDRKTMMMILFVVLFATPFIVKNISFGIFPQYRYVTYYMSVLLPSLVMVGWNFVSKILGKTPFSIIILSTLVTFFSTFGWWFTELGIPKFPNGFYHSIEVVKKIPKGHFLLDHHFGVHSYNWIAEANLPLAIEYPDNYLDNQASIKFNSINRICNEALDCEKSIKFIVTDYDSEFNQVNQPVLDSIINNSHNNYLVLFENRPLDRHFGFRKKYEEYLEYDFEKVFEQNGYRIYHQASQRSIKPLLQP
ncbi:MAG: glycosyltransferase family 39 protein [Flavobacteriales bacterium]|nr:glycosyltransferase family 39 protein [Flavobacteriales bacterium]